MGPGEYAYAPYESDGENGKGFFFEILENAPDSFFSLTPEGVITYINPAFEALTGWERGEWIGRPFRDLFIEDMGDDALRDSLKFENGGQRRVIEADMDHFGLAWKDRTTLMGITTDGDDVMKRDV